MGVNNRQRRRAKRWRREQAQRARPAGASAERPRDVGRPDDANEEVVRGAVLAAAQAHRRDPGEYTAHLGALASLAERGRRAHVNAAVSWWLDYCLTRAWTSGWQPADVERVLRRELSPAHAFAAAGAIVASATRAPEGHEDDRWAGQVRAIASDVRPSGATSAWPDLALPIEAMSVLLRLPPLPRLITTRRASASPASGDSSRVLERVRALLAKAESTTFREEAEALTAKAQQLMARHAIDQAMLDAHARNRPTDVVAWRISVDDPYAGAKSLLLDRIADAGGCRAVWSKPLGFSTVFGVLTSVEMTEILFTSLLVQATDAMVRAGSTVDRSGRSRTRSFRQSFLVAYAHRIGERLSAATAQAVVEGTERHGADLLPVLARRAEAVDEAVQGTFPHLAPGRTRVNNYAGWIAGRAAAEVASLSAGGELASGL